MDSVADEMDGHGPALPKHAPAAGNRQGTRSHPESGEGCDVDLMGMAGGLQGFGGLGGGRSRHVSGGKERHCDGNEEPAPGSPRPHPEESRREKHLCAAILGQVEQCLWAPLNVMASPSTLLFIKLLKASLPPPPQTPRFKKDALEDPSVNVGPGGLWSLWEMRDSPPQPHPPIGVEETKSSPRLPSSSFSVVVVLNIYLFGCAGS